MDDLEFRRRALTNPKDSSNEFTRQCDSSEENQQLVNELKAQDEDLLQALSVDVPEGLKERIILRQDFISSDEAEEPRTAAPSQPTWLSWLSPTAWASYAMAASVLFAVTLGVVLWQSHSSDVIHNRTSSAIFAHIYEELDHLYEQQRLNVSAANLMMKDLGLQIEGNIGQINYAGRCAVDKKLGIHLVLAGEAGPVTVLILPNNPVAKDYNIEDERFSGHMVAAGRGSIAIVGEKGENIASFQQRLSEHLVWSI